MSSERFAAAESTAGSVSLEPPGTAVPDDGDAAGTGDTTGTSGTPAAMDAIGADAVRVTVTDDKLSVLLDCPDPRRDLPGVVKHVLAAFARLKLPETPTADELAAFLTSCGEPGHPLQAQPVIMGYAATPPVDGRLEWTRDYFAEGWQADAAGSDFDFFARLDNRGVAQDELLATMWPPVPGEPGMNVFGAKLAVGKPQKARLRCGKGVATEEDADGTIRYRATVAGRVRLNDGTVAVDDVYIVRGNLGLAIGNVHHTGTLQVEGDIEQGVTVEVHGDIVVRGMIEPCTITCGGNLQVAGGIVGNEEHRITLGGGLQARYVRDAVIDAVGDVSIAGEISHATLRTLGRVLAPAGRIAGGLTVARAGITVGQAGAAGATGTVLVAGLDYQLEPRVAALEERLAREDNRRINAERTLAHPPLATEVVSGAEPIPRADLEAVLAGAAAEAARLKAEIAELIAVSEAACHAEIAALQEVWSGTAIQLGHERLQVRASVRKPRLARLSQGRVALLPLGEGNMPDAE
jgi:uncharacterized protein